jgi:hypothetical protein
VVGNSRCEPPSPPAVTMGFADFRDVRGTAPGGELWALTQPLPLPSGRELKIVWRMTGSGDLRLEARHPDGTRVLPRFLTFHGGSSWSRPGDEWGSGFTFPKAGCWEVQATRDSVTGRIWFVVT